MIRCPICMRKVHGEPIEGDERPCVIPAGVRCFELGFERLRHRLEQLESDPVVRGRIAVMELANA